MLPWITSTTDLLFFLIVLVKSGNGETVKAKFNYRILDEDGLTVYKTGMRDI